MDTMNQHRWGKRRFLFIPIFITGLFVISGIVMLLWNAVLPNISGLSPLNYWQAMGVLVLSRILFSGFRFGAHHGHRPPFMHPSFRDKLMNMSDEEKEQFRNQWRQRCCK